MNPLVKFSIIFVYTSILWGVVVYLYNRFFEPFEFGTLGSFLGKSALLIFVVSLCGLHFIGILISVLIWWAGLRLLFKEDFWACRILVLLLWGLFFASSILIAGFVIEEWDLSLEIG